MARMSADEWEAVFDADSWITGPELLDRVDAEIKNRIATRDIFGVIERETVDGVDRLLVYSDEGYATVSLDGTVRGEEGCFGMSNPSWRCARWRSTMSQNHPKTTGCPRRRPSPNRAASWGT